MDKARYGALVVSCCLMLSVCTPNSLSAQTLSTTGQQSPSAALPQTLEPVVVTGRADDLTGVAESASEGRVARHKSKPVPFFDPEKCWKSCLA